jgi:hypothetical protein
MVKTEPKKTNKNMQYIGDRTKSTVMSIPSPSNNIANDAGAVPAYNRDASCNAVKINPDTD